MSKSISKEELLGPITDMIAFQIDKQSLECQELANNPIYEKLKHRLLKFYVTREEYRRYGLS
jgi:hypothetical protein